MRTLFASMFLFVCVGCNYVPPVGVASIEPLFETVGTMSGSLGDRVIDLSLTHANIENTDVSVDINRTFVELFGEQDDESFMVFLNIRDDLFDYGVGIVDGDSSGRGCYGTVVDNWDYDRSTMDIELEIIEAELGRIVAYELTFWPDFESENQNISGYFNLD